MSLQAIPPDKLDRIMAGAMREARARAEAAALPPVWTPQPGPQTLAYQSQADVIGYGGAAGGGKSDLLLGLAGTKHRRSLIFRRVFPSLRGMIERSREIFNRSNVSHAADSFNESTHVWRLSDERMIELGAAQYEADLKKWQGQPHDLLGFDEATEFPESFIRFLSAWLRTTVAGQHCQLVLTFNPPLDDTGTWIVAFFAPWLDEHHPRPAADGELRWFASVDGKEIECGPEPFEHNGLTVVPLSRTFFHAALRDNPILEATGYGAQIDALPEPLRSILRGSFSAGNIANPFQVIPSAWVRAAQARWIEREHEDHGTQTSLGADISRGGQDQTVIAPLYGDFFAALKKYPGSSVPDGPTAAGLIIAALDGQAAIGVDVIGYGSSAYDSLTGAGVTAYPINFAEGTANTDKSGRLRMLNVRAAACWKFREALDPENDSTVCLPPDPELLADLCAATWKLNRGAGKVQIEDKEEIKARIGRSPDCADAVVLAWWAAQYNLTDLIGW